MVIGIPGFDIKKWKDYADWKLLIFLLLFLNVKLALKIPAIALIYLLQFNFQFGFKLKNSRLPLFYPLIIAIAVVAAIFNKSFQTPHYLEVIITGIFFWILCILAIHQIKLAVESNGTEVIHHTLLLFFIINAAVSAFNLLSIIYQTGALNPYLYQGDHQKYFINTGDHIRGLSFDISTTNAVLNAIGVLYFLVRKNAVMLMICMATLLLTGSNFVNIALLLILVAMFIFKTTRNQKSMIAICAFFLIVFLAKISPQNNLYVKDVFITTFTKPVYVNYHPPAPVLTLTQRPDNLLNPEEKKQKKAQLTLDSLSLATYYKQQKNTIQVKDKTIPRNTDGRIVLPVDPIHTEPYQSIKTPQSAQLPLIAFVNSHKTALPLSSQSQKAKHLPGKVISFLQTLHFYALHPAKLLFGNGMGNFSSKLAFRATGLGFAGGFPQNYTYINSDFLSNHLDVYLNYFSKPSFYHSLTNSPFSVYDQLLAEYGILGVLLFVIYYVGYFLKHYKALTYALPVSALIMCILFIDYWFEQLSVLVIFELIILINIKEADKATGGLQHAQS